MFEFLAECNPFHIDTIQINLSSGEVAIDESVDAFQAQAIRESLIQDIIRTSAFDYKFRKREIVIIIIIKTNASVNIGDRIVEGDSRLFFLMLSVFIQPEEINYAFNYEF